LFSRFKEEKAFKMDKILVLPCNHVDMERYYFESLMERYYFECWFNMERSCGYGKILF
jgi:hypothetical protein